MSRCYKGAFYASVYIGRVHFKHLHLGDVLSVNNFTLYKIKVWVAAGGNYFLQVVIQTSELGE